MIKFEKERVKRERLKKLKESKKAKWGL
jgi:hypothetical protein